MASNFSEEQLLERAGHAGRNLGVLATLASLLTIGILVVSVAIEKAPPELIWLGLAAGLIAAGYWVLMVAAKRGEPSSVTIVIVLLVLHLAVGVIMMGVAAAATGKELEINWLGLVIPVLVIAALVASRTVLQEIRKRNLTEKAFPVAAPAGQLCVVGGILLALGFVGVNVGMFALGRAAGQRAAGQRGAARREVARLQEARVFVHIVGNEEKAFLDALKAFFDVADEVALPAAYQEMNAKLVALEKRVEAARKGVTDNEPLARILTSYASAVGQWRKGVDALALAGADPAAVQKHFEEGDRFRTAAAGEFEKHFCGPEPD